jgi:bla regulator protein BlaR1
MIGEITNHLWQSTVFAFAIALLALAFRKNRAEVRYWLWLSASLKFLVPFSLLIGVGVQVWNALPSENIATHAAGPSVSQTAVEIIQPFPETFGTVSSAQHTNRWIPIAILSLWAFGFLCVVLMRTRSWLRVRAVVRASAPINIVATIPVRSSATLLEPGVVGFLHPVLLLPEGILRKLTPPQLESIVAHEQCHVRRRDNLTSSFHMIVEAIFWFHPIVWWIGAKLLEERERACDEAVLNLGNEPQAYAEGILNVCKSYLESPLHCVSGATGSDLKKRIRAILSGHVANDLSLGRKVVLSVITAAILAVPIVVGAIMAPAVRGHSLVVSIPQEANAAKFEKFVAEVVTIKRTNLNTNFDSWGIPSGSDTFSGRNMTLMELIRVAFGIGHGSDGRILAAPDWFSSDRYDIDAKVDGAVADALWKLPADQRQQAIQHILLGVLTDRCKLVVHREAKELPLYTLVAAKSGSKLKQASLAEPNVSRRGVWMQGMGGPMEGRVATMEDLVQFLSYILGRTTVDNTGITGSYDFTVKWTLDDPQGIGASGAAGHTETPPTPTAELREDVFKEHFFSAIQEQMGLKLESSKGPVEVIVIDHVERPSPN